MPLSYRLINKCTIMKKYKIVENHSGVNGDYVVKVYTDSFAHAVNVLSGYHNPFGSDIKSSTLSMKSGGKYIVIGTQERSGH